MKQLYCIDKSYTIVDMEDFHGNEVNDFWKEYNIKLGELKSQFENADNVASIRQAKIDLNNLQTFSTNGSRILPL